jgi:hypothetical protein
MKKIGIFLGVLLVAALVSSGMAAKFYWETTLNGLNSVSGAADGDRGLVIGTSGVATFYIRTGGAWEAGTVYSTALAANGANCSAGSAPLGIDASGNAEGCWDVTASVQSQVDGKQDNAANLTALSGPSTWKLFYSDGSSVLTELTFGDNGTVLQSNGAAVAPSWESVSSGSTTTSLPWDNITSRPTINSVTVTGAVLDNASNYPTLNQDTTGNASTATALSGQYVDWNASSGGSSVANRPTINGAPVTGSVLDNVDNYPAFVLGTNTSGDYASGVTADGFLEKTGTEGASFGLRTDCAENQIPKWNGSAWACASDAQNAGDNPTFDNVQSGTNTASTMTVGTGGTLTFSGSGVVNASQYKGSSTPTGTEFDYVAGVTSAIQTQLDAKGPVATINGVTVSGTVLDNVSNYPTFDQDTTGSAGDLVFGSDARGDLAVRGASAYGRLAKGASGAILTGDGTDPAWSAYTLAAPGLSGAVLYSNGTNWTRNASPSISAANMTSFPTLNQNTAGTAAGLTSQYIDWNASSGGSSVMNRPTINGVPVTGSTLNNAANYPTLNQNTTGSAGSLTTQYINWNASSGGTSIANKPTLGTASAQNVGTLADTKYCIYTTGTGIVCNSEGGGSGGTTSLPWDNITSRPTFNGATLTGNALDQAGNYPTLNQSTTGNAATATTAATATALSGQYIDWDQSSGATSVANRPTMNGSALTGAVLDNVSNYPTFNQDTTGNAATATALSGQYIDWDQSSGATSVANRPTMNGSALTGAMLDNVSNYPVFVLGTGTSGDYASGVTADGFLEKTGTEGATFGLRTDCAENQIPKWNGSAWACASDAQNAGDNPTFDNVTSGTNTSATMTVGTGGTLTYSGSGVVNASKYQGNTTVSAAEFGYLDNVSSGIQTQFTGKAATDQTMNIGTTEVAINRASAALVLTGITSIDGTAANLSGTPDLPDGTTATSQAADDNSTNLATTLYVDRGLADKEDSLGFTAENTANKGTDNTLGTSDTIYPSQKAVKQYVDDVAAGKQTLDIDLTSIAGGVTGIVKGAGNGAGYSAAVAGTDYPPIASPTFTGTVTVPTPFTIGAVSMTATGTELNYVAGVTSDIQSQLDAKAALVSPSFTTPDLGAATATTLNTGQGANDLYGMDQSVKTTDNVVFSSVTTDEWVTTCIASDNACGIGLGNQSDPEGEYLEAAQLWFNTTDDMVKVRNGDNTATQEVFTSGAQHSAAFLTTGPLSGRMKTLTDNTAPLAADMGGVVLVWTQSGTTTLPAALEGMSACILDTGTAHDLILDVQAGDDIEMTAGQQTNGVGITNASGSSTADFACVVAWSDGHWTLMGSRGTWTSQ